MTSLDKFLEEGAIFEGDYLEFRLFLMYLKVYQPSTEEIMAISHKVWADLDHEDLQLKYHALTKVDTLPKTKKPSALVPVAPSLDSSDDITKPINADINAIVESMWSDRSNTPIVPRCEPIDVFNDLKEFQTPPMKGTEISTVIDETMTVISKYARRIQNPGHFGFIAASGVPTDPLSFAMTAAVNQNVPAYTGSPIMATLETTVISWLCQLIGFDEKVSDGCLLSGGSTSNLTAVAASLVHKYGPHYREKGLHNLVKPGERPVVICSAATHFCIQRAAGMLGIGVDNVVPIGGDENFSMKVDLLEEAIKANPGTVCVVANAGSTTTGAIDAINDVADLCEKYGVWLHVDGAYGGSALMSPELKDLFKGIHRADSVTMDLHKWFFMSYDASAIVFKDPKWVNLLFTEQSSVVKELNIDTFASQQIFFNLGPELSRRARCLPIYIAWRHYGVERMGKNVLYQVQCIRYLADVVKADPDFTLINEPLLSIMNFRMTPEVIKDNEDHVDELNKYVRDQLEKEGNFFLSPTTVLGRPTLRVCMVNHNARAKDLDILMDNIRKFGAEWMKLNYSGGN